MVPGNQCRHLVQVYFLQRNTLLAFRQVGSAGIQACSDFLDRQLQQGLDIAFQVEHDHPVVDVRVARQRQHRCGAQAAGRVAHGNMQYRLHRHHVEQAADIAFVAQAQCVVPHARLRLAEALCHADGGVDVGQCFVGIAFAHVIGQRKMLELERGCAVFTLRPVDTVRAQRVHQPQHVEQVPARVAAAPFTLIGIMEIAEQAVTHELIIETQRVVTQRAGLWLAHQLIDAGEGLRLADPFGQCMLRRDAGDQRGNRRGQQVVGRLDVEADRLVDDFQVGIGAHRGELGDAGAARVLTKGFQVVEQEALGHQCAPSRTGRRSWTTRSKAAQSMLSNES